MKLSRRFYNPLRGPKYSQLVLIPETDGEIAMIDSFFGEFETPLTITGVTLHTDDSFMPYIKIGPRVK